MAAAMHGHIGVAITLFFPNWSVVLFVKTQAKVTPLMAAAMHGNIGVVDALLGFGVDVNATEMVRFFMCYCVVC